MQALNTPVSTTYNFKQKRLLCDVGTESAQIPSFIVWKGRSTYLVEKISGRMIHENHAQSIAAWDLADGYDERSAPNMLYVLYLDNGYFPNMIFNGQDLWKPGWMRVDAQKTERQWKTNPHTSTIIPYTIPYASVSASVTRCTYSGNNISTTRKLVSVGLIYHQYDSEHIYQDGNDVNFMFDKELYTTNGPINLTNGLQ